MNTNESNLSKDNNENLKSTNSINQKFDSPISSNQLKIEREMFA